jgi:hypothetical protein
MNNNAALFGAIAENTREKHARAESDRERAAEDAARLRRTDKDRIIRLAIDSLVRDVIARGWAYPNCFIGGCAGISAANMLDSGDAYVGELLAEILAQLSPLTR